MQRADFTRLRPFPPSVISRFAYAGIWTQTGTTVALDENLALTQALEQSANGWLLFAPLRAENGQVTDFVCSYANPSALTLLAQAASLTGQKLTESALPDAAGARQALYLAVWQEGEAHSFDYEAGPRQIHETCRHCGRYLVVELHDVSLQNQAYTRQLEAELAGRIMRLSELERRTGELLDLNARTHRLEESELLQEGLELARKLTSSQFAHLHFVDQAGLLYLAAATQDTRGLGTEQHPLARDKADRWADCLNAGVPVIHNDYSHGKLLGILRHLGAPMLQNGLPVMMIGVANKPVHYDKSDAQILQLLAQGLWKSLQQQRTLAIWQADRRRLEQVIAASRASIWEYRLENNQSTINIAHPPQDSTPLRFRHVPLDAFIESVHQDDQRALLHAFKACLIGRTPHCQQEFRQLDPATVLTTHLTEILKENMAELLSYAEVQKLLPNRNGMTTDHGLWPGASAKKGGIGNGGIPDVKNVACMKNCKPEVQIGSTLPDYARTAHGELADQNRNFGAVRGTRTLGPEAAKKAADAGTLDLATKSGCMACHGMKNKIVGPGYNEIVARYQGQTDAESRLVAKVKAGGQGVWGSIPMPPNAHVKDEDITTLVKWILNGSK